MVQNLPNSHLPKALRFIPQIFKVSLSMENLSKLDISGKTQVEESFKTIKPDVVVHAASVTDVDKCETNKELAWKINVEGTKNIVEAAQRCGSFLIYISTDYVFSGEQGTIQRNR